jgi:hypothetical protein
MAVYPPSAGRVKTAALAAGCEADVHPKIAAEDDLLCEDFAKCTVEHERQTQEYLAEYSCQLEGGQTYRGDWRAWSGTE